MKTTITNIFYMIGALVVVMYTIVRSALPAIMIEYQTPILIATIVLVMAVFIYNKRTEGKR